jgi:hypothetical protein
MSEQDEQIVGWQVTDPDGNVVQAGTVVVAQMADETALLLKEM